MWVKQQGEEGVLGRDDEGDREGRRPLMRGGGRKGGVTGKQAEAGERAAVSCERAWTARSVRPDAEGNAVTGGLGHGLRAAGPDPLLVLLIGGVTRLGGGRGDFSTVVIFRPSLIHITLCSHQSFK